MMEQQPAAVDESGDYTSEQFDATAKTKLEEALAATASVQGHAIIPQETETAEDKQPSDKGSDQELDFTEQPPETANEGVADAEDHYHEEREEYEENPINVGYTVQASPEMQTNMTHLNDTAMTPVAIAGTYQSNFGAS